MLLKKLKSPYLILILILLLGAILRLYRLPEMAHFDFDQEYAANFAYAVLRVYPIQLIGQGLSVQGLFMGPLYFYYLTPFFALFKLHPVGGAVGSVTLGLVTVVFYFLVVRKILGTKAGLIAAFFRALLVTNIAADLEMVPAYASDLIVLLSWYFFYKYWHKQTKYLIPLGFVFGLYTSIHPILFPFYLVFLLLLLIKRVWPSLKTTLLALVAFLIPLAPLILFEYFHKFLEIKRLIGVEGGAATEPRNLERLIYHLSIILLGPRHILGLNFIPDSLWVVFIISAVLILGVKGIGLWKDKFHITILALSTGVFLIYYSLLPTHVPEYYLSGPIVLIVIYLAASLSLLTGKTVNKVILTIFLAIILYTNFNLLRLRWNNPAPNALANKDAVVRKILQKQPSNQEFYVSYIKTLGWNFGFNYLFKYYQHIPQTKEAKPPIYTIVIPKALVADKDMDFTSGNIGLILPK